MKKLLIVLFSAFFLGGCTIKSPFLKKPAGLDINTTPASQIFLNGEDLGNTPYSRQDLSPGDYHLKLIPLENDSLPAWETNLTLKPEVKTVVARTFAEAESDSSGHILELVKEPGDKTYLSVISDPDTANLHLDNKPTGYTPVTKLEVGPGNHQLILSSPGYKSLELSVNAVKGYNLIVNAKLASDVILLTSPPPASESATTASPDPSSSPQDDTPYVVIQETGTGWLRVRSEPSASGEELGKANVGDKLPYLGETSDTGWHQVKFDNQEGWVSAKYAQLVE